MVRGLLAQRGGRKPQQTSAGTRIRGWSVRGVQTARRPPVDRLLLGTGGGWRDPLAIPAYRGRYDGFGLLGMLSRARLFGHDPPGASSSQGQGLDKMGPVR